MKQIEEYQDALHGEHIASIEIGDHGYKYRTIDGVMMPPYITPDRYRLSRSLKVREGDICFTSYPKSGSTWLSHIIYLIVNNGETPDNETLRSSLHWVASSWPYPRSREELESLPSPRIFKSHMPFHMSFGEDPLSSPCKYIYIARNPKDVAVSYYYFESGKKWAGNYSGSWEHWLDAFLKGKIQRGDWFDHVLSWWKHKDADNMLFLRYEDMKNDFGSLLRTLSDFLGYELTVDIEQIIRQKTSFNTMKKDNFSNLHEIAELDSFFREGQIGSWKNKFTVAQSEYFDEVYTQRMTDSGLEFQFE